LPGHTNPGDLDRRKFKNTLGGGGEADPHRAERKKEGNFARKTRKEQTWGETPPETNPGGLHQRSFRPKKRITGAQGPRGRGAQSGPVNSSKKGKIFWEGRNGSIDKRRRISVRRMRRTRRASPWLFRKGSTGDKS